VPPSPELLNLFQVEAEVLAKQEVCQLYGKFGGNLANQNLQSSN